MPRSCFCQLPGWYGPLRTSLDSLRERLRDKHIKVCGKGFLKHMVRRIVGLLVEALSRFSNASIRVVPASASLLFSFGCPHTS